MKANVWDFESLGESGRCMYLAWESSVADPREPADVAEHMDEALPEIEESLKPHTTQFGQRKDAKSEDSMFDILDSERFTHSKGPLTDVRKDQTR